MTLGDLLEQELKDSTFLVEGLQFKIFPIILGGNIFKQKFLKQKIVTGKQEEVLRYMFDVYGNDIARAILDFKKKIINPFNKIKDKLQSKQRISSKDLAGMTKEEFTSNLESGRKKIQARGEQYFEKVKDIQRRLEMYKDRIDTLKAAKNELKRNLGDGETYKIDYNVMNMVYKKYDLDFEDDDRSELGSSDVKNPNTIDNFGQVNTEVDSKEKDKKYTRHQFDLIYNRITKEFDSLTKSSEKIDSSEDPNPKENERALARAKRLKELWHGQNLDLIKNNKGSFYKDNKFKANLAKYFFSRDILDRVKKMENATGSNLFRDTYLTILNEREKSIRTFRQRGLQDLITLKKSIQFTDKESQIWEKRSSVQTFTNRLEDYIQKVEEDDFLEKPIYVKKTPEMKSVEDTIENENRKFIRKLNNLISEEDLDKLKEVGLIGKKGTTKITLDKMGDNMFNSDSQIKTHIEKEGNKNDEEENGDDDGQEKKKSSYLSPEDFHRRLREIATIRYENVTGLNRGKKEALTLKKTMMDQGDEKFVKEHKNLLDQIAYRKGLSSTDKIRGEEVEAKDLIDIDVIQRQLQRMIKKNYDNPTDIRADRSKFDQLIKRFKKELGSEADRELEDIQFLYDQYKRKITEYQYGDKNDR